MEAVENLMVGEETCAEAIVGKALVKRMVDRLEAKSLSPHIGVCLHIVVIPADGLRRQNLLQSLLLLAAVCKYI